MSERVTVARPYAKAAFVLARQSLQLPHWSDVINLSATIVSDSQVHPLLDNPHVLAPQLVDFICDVGGAPFDSQARNFLGVLAENRRLSYLPEIAQLFAKMRADYERVVDVTVASAVELSAEQRERFTAALARRFDRQIRLHTRIDSNLLGGAVVQADDLVIDGSVRGGLAQLATQVAS
ncbi:MAG TPA: F0F1 ATP synthase subunit delta [Steroidobacteraceae bacterium]|jgi:F-type H+-transporting ATPase subunit delta|nr:F0F1 ATP synthase subunit delta [Steroidobacteraceae bacterium]